ncbi:ABC-type metal ion transport system, periplasmic component/surface adhesin [Methanomethylovorans hollandica DSM 15978]|uniref:ABC-type metal ion transport system, periplasmic component/surface adhesin n=1 Tax=Methanomethylovorans hollandica (strain DSM 15978 / NBRC 107637 / DMS1) TaxID=867904 RepID=L0L063_METHD|nr:zinc ABC transporter substrate-binding protein [Methanomethylovorans hollandica]AGB50300.1 ABC-type metal ion transport system, periplasmic component/surface adhesin [Methanomethylovorans hollandica DSM 15978]
MNKLIKPLVICAICAILLFSGCTEKAQNKNTETSADELVVAVSVLPQAEFVEQIGGDKVRTVVMIPSGASVHTYEPTPNQLKDLSKAQIYVKVGSNLDFELVWMDDLLSVNPDMYVVNSSEGIQFRSIEEHAEEEANTSEEQMEEEEREHTGLDPHVWTSPQKAKIIVKNIYDGLVAVDPENEETYKQNYDVYITKLDEADAKLKAALAGKEGSSFIVYHPAWGYLADDYGLHEISIEIEGKEPSAQDMQKLIDTAKEKGIKVIFVQKGFSTSSAQTIAKQIGGEVVEIDPLAKDYIDNLGRVSNAFAKGLA